jgi:alkylation response protein AidB-like acyl-CoA dehydrogenase
MNDYTPPLDEQRFVLDHVARIDALLELDDAGPGAPGLVEAILNGAGDLAARSWAPTNRIGDTNHPQFNDGQVTMPPGFREAYRAYVDGGWGTIAGPLEFGGQGLPGVLATATMESFGTANMGFGLCPILTSGAVEALLHHGTPAMKEMYLAKLVSGEWTGTMNLTEPQAGSDVGAIRSVAKPAVNGGWRISGTKIFITFGEHDLAENVVHLVLARTPGAPAGTKGISLFLVPKFRPDGSRNDVQCASIELKLGIHSSPTCVMIFGDRDDCHGWLVGPEHGGLSAMFTMMNSARLNIGLQGVQIAERATQAAMSYAKSRVQSPRAGRASAGPVAISEHADVRRMLMRMSAQTQAIRALVYLAAAEADRASGGDRAAGPRLDLLTPMAKAHATDVGCEVASIGIQVHGGAGFIEETGVAQYYRDARIAPIYEGTNGIQAIDLVGRKLLGDGGTALRNLIAEIREEASHPELTSLIATIECLTEEMLDASIEDRLASAVPYLTMVSTMACGWLMERQHRIATRLAGVTPSTFVQHKAASCAWYLEHIVAEAAGLAASVRAGSRYLDHAC